LSPVSVENLERDIAIIRKRRGDDAIHKGSQQPPVDRIPLESPALMRITSGGIPLGRITRLWGPPSSAKTRIIWEIFKSAQELRTPKFLSGLLCAYVNAEKQYDPVFVKSLGVDIDILNVLESEIIEDIAREVQLLLGSTHVIAIDSCSNAIPQDRLNKDPGDWDMALDTRVWTKCLGYIHNAMDKDENAVIMIDHASRDWATKSEKALGGKEMEHNSSMSVHFKKGKWLYYDDEGLLSTEDKLKEKGVMGIAGQKEADGQEIIVQINKSRVCRPLRVANLRLDLNTFKFDHTFELMQGAEYFDKDGNIAHRSGTPAIARRVSKQGGWYELLSGQKIQGERALRLMLDADKDLADLTRKAMMRGN
jgi:RecA/RadA recombinase